VIDLPRAADVNDDIPDLDDRAAPGSEKPRSASDILPALALDASLSATDRRLLKQRPYLVIIKVPAAPWAKWIANVLQLRDATLHVCSATELSRSGGKLLRTGGHYLSYLQDGDSVVYVCQDPEQILDEVALAVADATIEIAVPTPTLLRRAIRTITGGHARGVTAEMTALDLEILLSVIRPGMSPKPYCLPCRATHRWPFRR